MELEKLEIFGFDLGFCGFSAVELEGQLNGDVLCFAVF
jgi:hypothetical protein